MKTTCPAVDNVCGPMNVPVAIHWELSAAVISDFNELKRGLFYVGNLASGLII
jgi:hypothetical protein